MLCILLSFYCMLQSNPITMHIVTDAHIYLKLGLTTKLKRPAYRILPEEWYIGNWFVSQWNGSLTISLKLFPSFNARRMKNDAEIYTFHMGGGGEHTIVYVLTQKGGANGWKLDWFMQYLEDGIGLKLDGTIKIHVEPSSIVLCCIHKSSNRF